MWASNRVCSVTRGWPLALGFALVCGLSALACQVPVFRYALERWPADKYEVLVIHDGLTAAGQLELARLQAAAQSGSPAGPANFQMRVLEAGSLRDARLVELWQQRTDQEQPLMVVLFPLHAQEVPDRLLQAGPLTASAVDGLLSSPVRREVAQRLSGGESAVWIFVPSGDAAQDELALKNLQQRLERAQRTFKVPTAEELEIDPAVLASQKLPLKIAFSVVTLERHDPREAFLLQALERCEADLPSTQPLAFPVFGRGRVLYALVGKGIMPATIDAACEFMVGPCSCQVKNQNPGVDLLLSHDWEAAVAGSLISTPIPDETSQPKLLTIPPGR